MHPRLLLAFFVVVSVFFTTELRAVAEEPKFDVNDVSFLWPVPKTEADAEGLLTLDSGVLDGDKPLLPDPVFEAILEQAGKTKVVGSGGKVRVIKVNESFEDRSVWKVAGVRVDPSAPSANKEHIAKLGVSLAQIRLVAQPVTIDGDDVEVHDVAMHVVFSYFVPVPDSPGKLAPDKVKFQAIVDDLAKLKKKLKAAGVDTSGEPLSIHPGFKSDDIDLTAELRDVLEVHLPKGVLSNLAFMGLDFPEPWIFFSMKADKEGKFHALPNATLGGKKAQMLSFRPGGERHVAPIPKTTILPGHVDLSTWRVFPNIGEDDDDAKGKLENPVTEGKPEPLLKDIPDIIANPDLAHVANTDCVSCHSESARRHDLGIALGDFRYKLPDGVSGVDEDLLPKHKWNVHNFGWFPNFLDGGKTVPSIALRTANEAAESVRVINAEYRGD